MRRLDYEPATPHPERDRGTFLSWMLYLVIALALILAVIVRYVLAVWASGK